MRTLRRCFSPALMVMLVISQICGDLAAVPAATFTSPTKTSGVSAQPTPVLSKTVQHGNDCGCPTVSTLLGESEAFDQSVWLNDDAGIFETIPIAAGDTHRCAVPHHRRLCAAHQRELFGLIRSSWYY